MEGDRRETEKGYTWCVCKRVYTASTILSRTTISSYAEDSPAPAETSELLKRDLSLRAIIVCLEALLVEVEGFLGIGQTTSGCYPPRGGCTPVPEARTEKN